jgi:hypothetical protein
MRVYSDRGRWFLYGQQPTGEWTRFEAHPEWDYEHTEMVKVCRFFDGITIAADGTVLNPPNDTKAERQALAEEKMRKRITRYVGEYMKTLTNGMPMPNAGDCWFCSMHVSEGKDKGKALGEVSHSDHLDAHMKERYYVPSLLWNAVRDRGYHDGGQTFMSMMLDFDAWKEGKMKVSHEWNSTQPSRSALKELSRLLGKYMRKNLIPTIAV